MAETGVAERIDTAIADFFSSWNLLTTLLVVLLAILLAYPLLTSKDPDTHPFLLARQSQIAPIRQPGESAVYRAIDIPHGYPLRAGLGVKDAGTPRWSAGRPGDLRDIWRQAVRGAVKEDGTPTGEKGKIQTILGREKIVDHSLDDLTLEINVIGQYVKRNNGQSVAVSLSNSPELLSSIFAGSFYGFSTVLLPYGLTPDKLGPLLSHTSVDHLIAEAGSLDLDAVLAANKNIKNIIWVTKPGSQHIDWSSNSPKGFSITSWQELIESNRKSTTSEVLPLDKDSQVPPVSIFTPTPGGSYDLIKYASENLISAIAAILATLPRTYKLSASDTLLPTTSLTDSYTLSWAFAALYSHSTLALNSVAGDQIRLDVAISIAKPTVLIASPKAVTSYLSDPRTVKPSGLSKFNDTRNLQAGNLPAKKRSVPSLPALSALRILLIPQTFTTNTRPTPTLNSADLHGLRLLLGARIGYALTSPLVAGAVAQTNILDYRDKGRDVICYGAPLSSVEINLEGDEDVVGSSIPKGKLSVKGPAVVGGGKVTLDITVQIDRDHTLVLP